jgi:hypothetical protein
MDYGYHFNQHMFTWREYMNLRYTATHLPNGEVQVIWHW